MALPRLSGALRAFSGNSGVSDLEGSSSAEIVSKRKQYAKEQAEKGLSWHFLVSTLKRSAEAEGEKVTLALRDLIQSTREIGGSRQTRSARMTHY